MFVNYDEMNDEVILEEKPKALLNGSRSERLLLCQSSF